MSAASNPPQPFVFVEGFEPAHYERTVRSYLSRKVWREKRVEQIRKYQKLSPPLPLTSVHSHLPFTKSSGKPAEAQAMMFPGAKLLPGWHRVFPRNRSDAPREGPVGPRNAETVPGNIHRPQDQFRFGTCLGLGQARL
jgi:hypothetical protein